MRSIALLNQKGGVGKTTTTANLGACLAMLGKRVLIVDMDPQANLSVHLGVDIYNLKCSVYNLIKGECKPDEVILPTHIKDLDIIPADIDLSGAEIELVGVVGRETVLKEHLGNVLDRYDYILFDCPPSLGLLTLNVLTLVHEMFIPVQTEFFALRGVGKLLDTFEVVRKRLNNNLEIEDRVFNTIIRKNVKLSESPSHGKPITSYAPDSYGSADYMALAKEVVQQENNKKS